MIPHSRPTIGTEEKKAAAEVLASGHLAQGPRVTQFEKDFCLYADRRFALAVSSGTAALSLALRALGIGNKDEVILPSYTCVALLHALDSVGAAPVPVDVNLQDFNISAEEVRKKIRKRTRAVLVPHTFGRPAQMGKLLSLGIPVIEDGTQALGASVGRRKVGNLGVISLFSFYATKMICTGEGGMLLTDSPALMEKFLDLRDYDKKERYALRTNSKMTDLEAALGIEQLKKLPQFVEKRRHWAGRYDCLLGGSKNIVLPVSDEDRKSVYYRYVIRVLKHPRQQMKEWIQKDLDIKSPVFKPIHRYLGLPDSQFPNTTEIFRTACSVPIFPSLQEHEWKQIEAVFSGAPAQSTCARYVEI